MATGLSSYSKRCKARKSSLTSWFDSSIASIAERLARRVPWVLRHSDVERIFYLDAQVADRGLQLGVAVRGSGHARPESPCIATLTESSH